VLTTYKEPLMGGVFLIGCKELCRPPLRSAIVDRRG